jgi:hypothetical protein
LNSHRFWIAVLSVIGLSTAASVYAAIIRVDIPTVPTVRSPIPTPLLPDRRPVTDAERANWLCIGEELAMRPCLYQQLEPAGIVGAVSSWDESAWAMSSSIAVSAGWGSTTNSSENVLRLTPYKGLYVDPATYGRVFVSVDVERDLTLATDPGFWGAGHASQSVTLRVEVDGSPGAVCTASLTASKSAIADGRATGDEDAVRNGLWNPLGCWVNIPSGSSGLVRVSVSSGSSANASWWGSATAAGRFSFFGGQIWAVRRGSAI